ncbi:hypothetical protein [Ornithinimicrobium tianjinense]|uniref:Uncharacterized protein n=1 Tax=Ornithinimicrobium tianjinense TaxID=1195761 RepID=A0A917F7E4_9MICO|nr:hypothetical protein [Ornithinimicrobium tianjinense]GGF55394.1 hypothetical protein GCM10011366_24140 [Ornithinimicrobium tianjinense]
MSDVNVWLLLVSFALGAALTWLATVRRVTVEVPPAAEPDAPDAPEPEAPDEPDPELAAPDDLPPAPAVDAVEAARLGALGAAGAGAAATLGIPDVEIYGPPAAMEPVDLPEAHEDLPGIRVQAPSWQGPLAEDEPAPAEPDARTETDAGGDHPGP